MAYVPGFEHDVFLSYAHLDNLPDPLRVQWVNDFHADLKTAIQQQLGEEIKLFFDTKDLPPDEHLQFLLENARKSVVFLAVLSPSYVRRSWTIDELAAFDQVARGGEVGRIVTVEVLPVEAEPLPEQFLRRQGLKRTPFWQKEEEHIPIRLTRQYNSTTYSNRVQCLAYWLAKRLAQSKSRKTWRSAPSAARLPKRTSPGCSRS